MAFIDYVDEDEIPESERVPDRDHIIRVHAVHPRVMRQHFELYRELMYGPGPLGRIQREMIAVVVSSANRCYYCLVAHGQAVRRLSGDPQLGEMMVMNYRVAELEPRQRAMLEFAMKMTIESASIEEADREGLRQHGFSDADIWDIAAVAGFFNMSNRMASALAMQPNREYHAMARG